MTSVLIGRRSLLAGAAGLAAVAVPSGRLDASVSQPRAPAQRGVNYDTERETWSWDFVRHDMRAIRRALHCNAVLLLGSDVARLAGTASLAADEGLYVWIEARQFDEGPKQTLAFLASVARAAERLRRRHPGVGISVGCELTIFMDGLVPGRDWQERGDNLGKPISAGYNKRLNAFLARAISTVRPLFGGRLTYSSGDWEKVGWRDFDAVGVDLYRDARNEATYAQLVRALHRHRKPVIITEFGCCAYNGADKAGGMGFLEPIDWAADPPVIKEGYVRDERVQARYLGELIDVHRAAGVYGSFVYDFVDRDTPYSPDPRQDFDMAGFSLVKVLPSQAGTARWTPRLAFHTVADRFKNGHPIAVSSHRV